MNRLPNKEAPVLLTVEPFTFGHASNGSLSGEAPSASNMNRKRKLADFAIELSEYDKSFSFNTNTNNVVKKLKRFPAKGDQVIDLSSEPDDFESMRANFK